MDLEPAAFTQAAWLFARAVCVVTLVAFVSLLVQLRGLFGRDGIVPLHSELAALRGRGRLRWRIPTLLWLAPGDAGLQAVAWVGLAAAGLALVDVATVPALLVAWACWLSFVVVGVPFLSYQWDVLLCEALPVAALLAVMAPPSPVALLLAWVLVLRLMVASGVAKLRSGDPTWRDGSALDYHFVTQPLPTRLAWYAHHLPRAWRRAASYASLGVEIAVPWLLLGPNAARLAAVALLAALQLAIAATGNYAFFNLLSLALLVPAVPDTVWQPLLGDLGAGTATTPTSVAVVVGVPAGALLAANVARLLQQLTGSRALARALGWLAPVRQANPYGLFAVMTTTRPELRIEGTEDLETWRIYPTRAKPSHERQAPRLVAPHQPRLDWQLWFAALEGPTGASWVMRLCERLLAGSDPVRRLLADDPFDGRPPRAVRVMVDRYGFADRAARAETGQWWQAEPAGVWLPPVELREGRLHVVDAG